MQVIRTKIVATMGPACSSPEILHSLFDAGVDVCRLNFSHGSFDEHLQVLRNIREAASRWRHPIAILGDLCGPKIRVGDVAPDGVIINVGDALSIQRQACIATTKRISTTYARFVDEVRVGDRVLIEDGMLRFVCVEKNGDELQCNCTMGGVIRSHKGINLPGTPVSVPSITDFDWE